MAIARRRIVLDRAGRVLYELEQIGAKLRAAECPSMAAKERQLRTETKGDGSPSQNRRRTGEFVRAISPLESGSNYKAMAINTLRTNSVQLTDSKDKPEGGGGCKIAF